MTRPVMIALVGVDGSGKSTQARALARRLTDAGVPASYFENAGGRPLWNRLARAVGRRDGPALFGRTLYPALEATVRALAMSRTLLWSRLTGRTAVLDRWTYCQHVIMAARGDRGRRMVRAAYALFPRPTVVCFLATSPAVAQRRVLARGIDTEELGHLRALDAAYRALPEFGSFVVVDGDGGPGEVAAALDRVVSPLVRR
ncbi:thymidylate kinase [Micromonospora globispora]|uniref:Thymidylate kinase n=1 Tax=Micromonospora globispora TaxID=1450148 RepID=A0A317K018_9ACTN|nr:thymidylate kinase [Micromonospora globispora]PWU45940.1 thymidylate kinase [Micromonospora globispora]PWU62250.1 thymidylate kinase [Micromonospora globispora]RQW86526.1 thymidylate kinase [Micromonospora globispora]